MEIDYEGVTVDEMNMDVDEVGFEEYEDTDDIDLKDRENEAWLIKLPAYLFDKWADVAVANDDTELAKVRFYEDSRGIGSQPPKKSTLTYMKTNQKNMILKLLMRMLLTHIFSTKIKSMNVYPCQLQQQKIL
jgi:hypothetical protein